MPKTNKVVNLIGEVYGSWTVVALQGAPSHNLHHCQWVCRCECGLTKELEMTLEVTMRDGTKYTINRETMTGVLNGKTRHVNFWPIEDRDADFAYSLVPDILSWREIPDAKPDVPELPILSGASVPAGTESNTDAHNDSSVSLSSAPPVSNSGTDWIK